MMAGGDVSARNVMGFPHGLPVLRGRLRQNVLLAESTWFRVGGAAEWLFRPKDMEDLQVFLRYLPGDVPLTILGVGSNILVRDGGIPGVTIRLGRGFAQCVRKGSCLTAGASCLSGNVAAMACKPDADGNGIGGLVFLSGIPGTMGGVVRMNGGAYGAELSDVCASVTIMNRQGRVQHLSPEEMGFAYRHSSLPEDVIITEVTVRGVPAPADDVAREIQRVQAQRENSQPIRTRTGGSTFKNPMGGQRAWQLVDEAGCRGLQIGGAKVSEKHCNFLENTGDATASDLEALGEEVRRRVKAQSGVVLEWEIQRVGIPAIEEA